MNYNNEWIAYLYKKINGERAGLRHFRGTKGAKKRASMTETLNIVVNVRLFLAEIILDFVVQYHFFTECISASLGRLYHFDNFGMTFTFTLLQGCNYFLCHD